MTEHVLPFEEALAAVLAQARGLAPAPAIEIMPLLEARGRVLARRILTDRDQPPFDRSTRDGYAVRAADVTEGKTLLVLGLIRAGESWRGDALGEGQAIEIMTGAPMPAGADAVLMVEHAVLLGEELQPLEGRSLGKGDNVVPRGAEARNGDSVLPAGRVIEAAEIAVAASCGAARLEMVAKPRVAIVATGDELVELGKTPEAWQIRNSNSYALAALVEDAGG